MFAASHAPVEASVPALLVALSDVAARVSATDPEAADGSRSATEQVCGALRRLLEHALDAMAALQRAEQVVDAVGDVCFAGSMELKRVLRELVAARDDDARLVAAETGRRKLRRAILAVLAAAREAGVHDACGDHGRTRADLASALAIRRLYAEFRRGLRRPGDDSPEAVLVAVRYAGGALAALVADPDYADVRTSDRAVLRRLRERALDWARHDRSAAAGLHLLDDVWTCGDLLRGINRRQELKDHDAALIAALLRGPDDDVAAWFAQLDALFGLDDDLDRLLVRADAMRRDSRALDPLVPDVLVRLSQVH